MSWPGQYRIPIQMGNQQHAELRACNSHAQARALVSAFNKIDQSWTRTILGFEIRFSEHFTTGFLQSYGESILQGRLLESKPQKSIKPIALTLHHMLDLRDMLQSLRSQNQQTPGNPDSRQTCCLCLDKYVTLMLPCAHSYCKECLDKFVLDKDDKKCPQCRAEFYQPKEFMQKKLMEILEDDGKDIINQIRLNIKDFIRRTNPNVGAI